MSISAAEINGLECPKGKSQFKKHDSRGLYLLVKPNNSKLWRFRYIYAGKNKEMALGRYPSIKLTDARDAAENARILLAKGVDPMAERKLLKKSTELSDKTFSVVALKWWEKQKNSWGRDHANRIKRWITIDAKKICSLSVEEIDAGHITELMLDIESSGHPKKAPVILSVINRIFGFALAHRLTRTNPAQGLPLRDIISPLPKVKPFAAVVKTAELIKLKWEYVDFEEKIIRIPEHQMKKAREHLVPLSRQVIVQLEMLKEITGYSQFVFPSQRNSDNPISKNVMTNRLRTLGYAADVMTAHGFRSTASTILHEQGYEHEIIEAQLAHLTGTSTSRAYNRSIHLTKRRKMMQEWANYLDELKSTQ